MSEGNQDQKRSLYQLVNDSRSIDDLMSETGGEITDEQIELTISRWMSEVNSGLAEKVDSYEFKQRALESNIESFKMYAQMFSSSKKSLERLSAALKDRMKESILALGQTQLKGVLFTYKLVNSKPSVVILDESKIPAVYVREKMVIEIDKDKLRHDLEHGIEVPGAQLEQGFQLRVSTNKGGKNEQ